MNKLKFKETPENFFARFPEACLEAKDWVHAKRFKTMGEAWKKCERGDWLLWWLGKENAITQKQSVSLAICFAGRVIKEFNKKYPDDKRPDDAIRAARAWLKSPTKKNRDAAYAAANAAHAAAYAAYAAANAAAYAAYAAANAAYAATYAAYAAAYAASAANAAAYAAYAATYAASAAANAAANAATADAVEQKWQANKIRRTIHVSNL